MSFDIDDEDREYFYLQHGRRKASRFGRLRRSNGFILTLITVVLLSLYYLSPAIRSDRKIDWSRYAYSLTATDTHSLCNAYMVFDALRRYGSKADRVLHYPDSWDTSTEDDQDRTSQLLIAMHERYKVKLMPSDLDAIMGLGLPGSDGHVDPSLAKLTAFQLTFYKQVLHIDTDIILRQHLDELFLLPTPTVSMPLAYWQSTSRGDLYENIRFTSMVMQVKPNQGDFKKMMELLRSWRISNNIDTSKRYDVELLDTYFGDNMDILDHSQYLLTSEFRRTDHGLLSIEAWDPERALQKAKLVRFHDPPLPKPWISSPIEGIAELQPRCGDNYHVGCAERRIWKSLYDDFRRQRKELCGLLSVPAPPWEQWKQDHPGDNYTLT